MKVLQVINSLGTGGAEKLLLETIPLYREKGIEMDILVLWDNELPFMQELKKLNCCKVYILNSSKDFRSIYNPLNIFKIRQYIKRYDIIHVHLFPAQYFVPLANIGLNKKLIFTEHNTTNRRIQSKLFKPLEKSCYSQFSKLVCISQEIKNIYSNYIKNNNKIVVINNGINLERISQAHCLERKAIHVGISENDVLILQVSAFRNQKKQESLILSLKSLPKEFKVLLAGDGDRKDFLVELSKLEGLSDRVIFLGQRMDIPSLLKSVDVVCLSSNYEGLSLASVEGLASGKPFIASDVPGLREVVDGAGILFENGNSKELAKKILQVSNDIDYRNDIVERSLARAKQYDINTMVSKHIELYREVYEKD